MSRFAHPQDATGIRRCGRRGFTLVELLVVIAIIAILAGLGIPAIMRAFGTATQFKIRTTVDQFAASVEKFKTDYGFYPPDFTRIENADQMLPYLNRIAPNHQELSIVSQPAAYAGQRRIDVWWNQVGRFLGPESALQFWLGGLAKSKQFPLTYVSNNGTPSPADDFVAALPPYFVNVLDNGTTQVPREAIHEYSDRGLIPILAPPGIPPTVLPPWDGQFGYACGFSQLQDNDKDPLVYFELASHRYDPSDVLNLAGLPGRDVFPCRNLAVGSVSFVAVPFGYTPPGTNTFRFYNDDKFQIIAFGVDQLLFNAAVDPHGVVSLNAANREAPNAADLARLIVYSHVFGGAQAYSNGTAFPEINNREFDNREADNTGNFVSGTIDSLRLQKL